jgi:hypothetical protein
MMAQHGKHCFKMMILAPVIFWMIIWEPVLQLYEVVKYDGSEKQTT